MQTAQIEQRPPAAQTDIESRKLPTGLDVGNGTTNLIVEGAQTRIPSYVKPLNKAPNEAPEAGFIQYIDGPRADLVGSSWLAGNAAYQSNPDAFVQVVADAKSGKITNCLHLLLGAISYGHARPAWNLQIVASIHHGAEMGDDLSVQLSGRHTARFNGNAEPVVVNVEVLRVLDEGAGAVISSGFRSGQMLVIDIGHGTIITDIFGEKAKPVPGARTVSKGGVSTLIDAIAKSSLMIQQLGYEGDREVIRRGIEAGNFRYGQHNGFSFEEAYKAELKVWIATRLKAGIEAGAKWKATTTRAIAVGGGSQLPIVKDALAAAGITPSAAGCWANAQGLYQAALLLGGK